jgi:hypothetical protein
MSEIVGESIGVTQKITHCHYPDERYESIVNVWTYHKRALRREYLISAGTFHELLTLARSEKTGASGDAADP